MTVPSPRADPRPAPPELLVLQRAEEFVAWLLERTARWPKAQRFTLTRRLEDLALGIVDDLVVARYDPRARLVRLDGVNLALERARFLLRLAQAARLCAPAHAEGAQRRIDELGRMLHGWRAKLRPGNPTHPGAGAQP